MSTFDRFTPCDYALAEIEHEPHSYIWADQEYDCRGYPARVVISRRTADEAGTILKAVYGDRVETSVNPPYVHRYVPPVERQRKEPLHYRIGEWLADLTAFEFWMLIGAMGFSAAVLIGYTIYSQVVF